MGQGYLPDDVAESDMKSNSEIDRHHREAAGFGKFEMAKATQEAGPIQRNLNILEETVSELRDSANGLIETIGPILGPVRSAEDSTMQDVPGGTPDESELATILMRIRTHIRRIDDMVNIAKERVEL